MRPNHNRFTHALLRAPAYTLDTGLTTRDLGAPDVELTLLQYAAYQQALIDCGVEVTVLPEAPLYPDAHFVEDTAVVYDDLIVLTQPGAPTRRGEVETVRSALTHGTQVQISGDGAFLEGGDVLFCADRVLIGLSKRTNLAGAEQLKHALQNHQANIKVDFVPLSGVLHLKTGITELAPGVLVRSPSLHTDYPFDFAEVITLPPDEEYSANVLPINNTLLIASGYPTVRRLAERHYTQIIEVEMSEVKKMDGSLTCLSIRMVNSKL